MELKRDIAKWEDYELLDSGDRMKLERFGPVIVARPEPQALWAPANPAAWQQAMARFEQHGEDGNWKIVTQPPEDWTIQWEQLRFALRLFSFKHTGLFPEQAANWAHLRATLKPGMQVLNLFGYTGGATLAALSAGAEVVHCDASRPAIANGKQSAALSGLADKPVRWIEDDAQKFVAREIRRERKYDCIIMDPPAFGRGPGGETWRFDQHLLPFLKNVAQILKPGAQLLVNAYSLGFSATVVEQVIRDAMPNAKTESVELCLPEKSKRGFLLPAGITIRCRV